MPRPLDGVPAGKRAVVREVSGGFGLRSRLLQMGIFPGEVLEVVYNPSSGPVVVRARGVLVSLGRGMARKVLVDVLD